MTAIRILCVDDEPRVLEGLENTLALSWDVATASGGVAGLAVLATQPYAVVISDMRMPGMSGAQFLDEARRRHPDTVRILLTGQADLVDTTHAINDGGIYRMLLKPCPPERLLATVADAVRHHELLVAEQVLLEQTLRGAVGVLVDMLGLIHPVAFGRTTRVVELVAHLVRPYQLADAWQLDLAAMLSQLGCVTLDATLIEAAEFGPLDPPQRAAFARHPAAGAGFLARIPRLDGVAAMVAAQLLDAPPAGSPTVQLGGEALQLAIQVDRDHGPGVSLAEAVGRTLARRPWTPQLATSLRSFRPAGAGAGHTLAALSARDLRPRMILEENATSQRGELWLAQGLVLTEVAVQRLRALAERGLLREPVAVRIEPLD